MAALKRVLPTVVAGVVGILVLLSLFASNASLVTLGTYLIDTAVIIAAFALILGVINGFVRDIEIFEFALRQFERLLHTFQGLIRHCCAAKPDHFLPKTDFRLQQGRINAAWCGVRPSFTGVVLDNAHKSQNLSFEAGRKNCCGRYRYAA